MMGVFTRYPELPFMEYKNKGDLSGKYPVYIHEFENFEARLWTLFVIFNNFLKLNNSQPNSFYWGHQYSWTLTPANSMQVSIMQSDNCNRK